MSRSLLGLTLLVGASLFALSCTPKYPKCDKDEHCKEGEFCVNGMCQQCRNVRDCPKGKECKGGRCEAIAGWCETAADCPAGQGCKDHRCGACTTDVECGPGGKCRNGKCLRPGDCQTNMDCPENQECQNGRCVAPPPASGGAPCTPQSVYFDFDEHVLTTEATNRLQAAAKCVKSVSGRRMRLEGHTDPRGTEEYNLSLGDKRSQSVQRYLQTLGVQQGRLRPVSKGELEAKGSDEGTWAKDRRVDFLWD
ncbi:MAG: OmpA family protein [Deltaproteobacteria bacterium]|nr:OmpA family protein [Deltaproteobacteria bacterium]